MNQFISSADMRVLEQPYYRNEDTGFVKWAKTRMTPQYTIGIFKNEIMWNQTRGLVAYFENHGAATYLQMRCLHDSYDYCSGVLSVAEEAGHLILGVRFLTNGGDTHPGLDRIEGRIEASDFRLRLEIGGCLEGVRRNTEGARAEIEINGFPLRIDNIYAAFDEQLATDISEQRSWNWEVTELEQRIGLDFIIYAGERKTIDFHALNRAAFLFTLAIGDAVEKLPDMSITEEDGHVTARVVSKYWNRLPHELTIAVKPNDIHPV